MIAGGHAFYFVRLREVGDERPDACLARFGVDVRCRRGKHIRPAADDRYAVAVEGEAARDRSTDAGSAAGDDDLAQAVTPFL